MVTQELGGTSKERGTARNAPRAGGEERSPSPSPSLSPTLLPSTRTLQSPSPKMEMGPGDAAPSCLLFTCRRSWRGQGTQSSSPDPLYRLQRKRWKHEGSTCTPHSDSAMLNPPSPSFQFPYTRGERPKCLPSKPLILNLLQCL